MTEQQVRQIIREEIGRFVKVGRYTFDQHIQLLDARNIQLGKTTGTKIGTETTQKLGFFNAAPVVQQSAITAPSGGATVDSQARTAINSIRTLLTTFGFTA